MDISEIGLEELKHPILAVRVQYSSGSWYVEYRRKPKYFFDGWWWFDDGIFKKYEDAKFRAEVLAAQGYVSEIVKQQPQLFQVKS